MCAKTTNFCKVIVIYIFAFTITLQPCFISHINGEIPRVDIILFISYNQFENIFHFCLTNLKKRTLLITMLCCVHTFQDDVNYTFKVNLYLIVICVACRLMVRWRCVRVLNTIKPQSFPFLNSFRILGSRFQGI